MLKFVGTALGLLAITACTGDVEYKYPEKIYGKYERPSEQTEELKNDKLFAQDALTFKFGGEKPADPAENQKPQKEKTKQKQAARGDLWQPALVVLADYPLTTVDKANGLIISEWFSDPENSQRQLKINAVITDFVKITVLSRTKEKKGEWINQKNDQRLADKIKNDIVTQTQH